jgi:hypothetical protein
MLDVDKSELRLSRHCPLAPLPFPSSEDDDGVLLDTLSMPHSLTRRRVVAVSGRRGAIDGRCLMVPVGPENSNPPHSKFSTEEERSLDAADDALGDPRVDDEHPLELEHLLASFGSSLIELVRPFFNENLKKPNLFNEKFWIQAGL